jgi:diguanylate cyclase (GGDEF)-like protein/PAS domain S-box-containing protein
MGNPEPPGSTSVSASPPVPERPASVPWAADAVLRDTIDRTQRQLRATSRALQLESIAAGDVAAAVRDIVVLAAEALGCERTNVWFFNDAETELVCTEGFEASTGRRSKGMVLREPDLRAEFETLRHARYVAADDALTDPRTAGYVESYLKPLGITSLLDVVIRTSGKNLGLFCFEHVGRPHHWEQDEIAFACQMGDKIGLVVSISERRLAEERLQFANTLLTRQMESSPDAVLVVDAEQRIQSWNGRFRDMWTIPASLVLGAPSTAVLAAVASQVADREVLLERLRAIAEQPDRDVYDEIATSDGRTIEVHSSALRAPAGEVLGRVWFFRDVSAQRRAEAEIRHRARHDVLTGLANRAVFKDAVGEAIARTSRGDAAFAVLYLDLDQFKDVNDTLGHAAGDDLLRQVAGRLRAVCRTTDTIARFGGDEFAVIAPHVGEPADAAALATALIEAIAVPFTVQGNRVGTGCSIGIVVHEAGTTAAETLLSQADLALYRAKADGRGAFRFFTVAMDDEVRTRVALGAELRTALAANQLFLVYQPQVVLETGQVAGVEAFVRWAHPVRGVLSPSVFIPVAEHNGLIRDVGRWVLREGCRQMRAWREAGVAPDRVSINLSTLQMRAPLDVERDLFTLLEDSGLPARTVELEVSEAAFLAAVRESPELLVRLRERGAALAIDNFGTGYSSLDYLRRFPVDRIKVARQFVQAIARDPGSAAIVRATIGLGRDLGMAVIAEGVETREQADELRRAGCLEAQGFYFSQPLAADTLTVMLGRGRQVRPQLRAVFEHPDAVATRLQ